MTSVARLLPCILVNLCTPFVKSVPSVARQLFVAPQLPPGSSQQSAASRQQAGRQAGRQASSQAGKQADWQAVRQAGRQAGSQQPAASSQQPAASSSLETPWGLPVAADSQPVSSQQAPSSQRAPSSSQQPAVSNNRNFPGALSGASLLPPC